jgi:hypothetical protein
MRDRIYARLGRADLVLIGIQVQARDLHRRQDRLHDEPRPKARQIVLNAPVAVKERTDQRNGAQNQRVSPNQRIENEVRAQPAGPAVAAAGLSCAPRPRSRRPRRDSTGVPVTRGFRVRGWRSPRLSSRAQLGGLFSRLRGCGDLIQARLFRCGCQAFASPLLQCKSNQ